MVAASPPMVEAFLDLQGLQMEVQKMVALQVLRKMEACPRETGEVHSFH